MGQKIVTRTMKHKDGKPRPTLTRTVIKQKSGSGVNITGNGNKSSKKK